MSTPGTVYCSLSEPQRDIQVIDFLSQAGQWTRRAAEIEYVILLRDGVTSYARRK